MSATSSPPSWSLVIHGGSGRMARARMAAEADAGYGAGLAAALAAGETILVAGGSAVDAVETAVRVLEDDPQFNAGRGAVFTAEGHNELDAAIMDGATRAAGAVAGVTRTKNPVSLARAVMAHSPHVLLARDGADVFSIEQGLEQVDPGYFRTEERWQALQAMKAAAARGEAIFDKTLKYGTVGAVARDVRGHLAAATSTGGLTGKRWGRIGDSPLIGAGTYADDRSVAVSATGSGEDFIRVGAAFEIGARV
ncbi:MAG: isoaspartyl peptidase/L-asparaginase, partial [Sandarakinorhabdus sp.]|nr:isoaspartyl peptidase/L-asparaginase [Sandarakinorhabdus sp.]